jgi:alpha-tubulin suppressor-like RCC1 family protein
VGLSNVVAIAAGNNHDLALKSDGTVVAWGSNYAGQTNTPPGLTGVTAIAAGGSHSLALTLPCSLSAPSALTATTMSASQINLAWLDNSPDENGFKIERSTDGTNFTQIAQVLPRTTSYRNTGLWPGTIYYYRVRPYNSGGDGDSSNVASAGMPAQCLTSIVNWGAVPPPPLDLTNVVAIAAGWPPFDLALRSDGTVVRWGGGPTPPPGLSNVVAIAAGHSFGLALKSDSTIVGWGFPPAATPPAGLSNVVAIAAGFEHSLVLKSDGTVVGWGSSSYGATNVPAGLSGVVGIAAGHDYSLALKSDGTVVGWGRNDYGQATPPSFLRAVTAIAAGDNHSLAITSYGTVVGWGNYYYGQTNSPAGLSGVAAIGAGLGHSVALKSNGTVVAWGNNSSGQTNVPVGLSGVVAIGAGAFHSLAMSCAPYAPSTLVATTVTKSQINLSWTDNSINEDRFGIERAASSTGPWTEIGSVDSDVTTYPDTGLSCGQTYYYRVRAYDAAGGSPYSIIATANTSPDDLDCDGIADSWMQQYFGHPYGQTNDNSRAMDDADGDGMSNLAEFQAGTDPTNSASAFRILEIAPLDEDMLITWAAVGGKWYIVQTATNLTGSLSNSFYDLNPVIIAPGTGEYALSVLHLGAATNAPVRLYRLRLVP